MKKRVKKELTLKEARIRCTIKTILLSFILLSILLSLIITNGSSDAEIIIASSMFVVITPFMVWFFVSSELKIDDLEFAEKLKKEKEICQGFLSKEVFTQVIFLPHEKSIEAEMCFSILKKTRFTFFAKFDNEENIIVIVKDKDDKEIYKTKISDYHYFNLRFSKKEN